jgi:hypothetical protein
LQAAPSGSVGERVAQVWTISEKPMSLPPMLSVTRSVPALSASSCGGSVPASVSWAVLRSPVPAPLQLTSTNVVVPRACAVRAG